MLAYYLSLCTILYFTHFPQIIKKNQNVQFSLFVVKLILK